MTKFEEEAARRYRVYVERAILVARVKALDQEIALMEIEFGIRQSEDEDAFENFMAEIKSGNRNAD